MNNKERGLNKGTGKEHNTQLLRVCVIFLSIVSFFTTANGMKQYIFVDNSVISYAASGAIQGILLALSMNLPRYLRNIYRKDRQAKKPQVDGRLFTKENVVNFFMTLPRRIGHFLFSTILCAFVVILTFVTIFCSTWFSYIYIADILHQDSWGVDSGLLIQQVYRTELHNARDYAHTYRVYLEDRIGEKLLLLEEQTKLISDPSEISNINWADEKDKYTEEAGTTVAGYMITVINAMESALGSTSSQEQKDIAATVINDTKKNIADRMESIQENLDTTNANITNYNTQITNLRSQINRAGEGTDVSALNDAINNYVRLLENLSRQQADLQVEYLQLSSALLQLDNYEMELGLSMSTSAISIRTELITLQTEFFQLDVDAEKLIDTAANIFKNFQNASLTAVNEEGSQEDFSYTNLLLQMNQLIQNLRDYSAIKSTELKLDTLISELGGTNAEDSTDSSAEPGESQGSDETIPPIETDDPEETADPAEPDASAAPEEPNASADPAEPAGTQAAEPEVSDDPADMSAGPIESAAPSDITESGASDSAPEKIQDEESMEEKVNRLRALISAMPVYSEAVETESEADSALSGSQINILTNYDREESGKRLDDISRRYISAHNAVYQGIIYLQSPYRSLALFALILALSFDLSGFVFGFVAEGQEASSADEDRNSMSKNKPIKWSVLNTMNPYIVLTGDYENRDGDYYYKAFKDGQLLYWKVKDTSPYSQGIYIQKAIDGEWSKAEALPEGEQALLFVGQPGGPKDGIYRNCQLLFDEGSLILVKENERSFLAGINEYVPVHSYNPGQGENRTIPSKQLAEKTLMGQLVVVTLNTKGTRVAAIYIIEQNLLVNATSQENEEDE